MKTTKFIRLGKFNSLDEMNYKTVLTTLFLDQLKQENKTIKLNINDIIKELELNNDKYSNKWNVNNFIKNILPTLTLQGLNIFGEYEIDGDFIKFEYNKNKLDAILRPTQNEEDFTFVFVSYNDLIRLNKDVKTDDKKERWTKFFIELSTYVYNTEYSEAKLKEFANCKFEWNYSINELVKKGFTERNIKAKKEVESFVNAINSSKLNFKILSSNKVSVKDLLSKNNTTKTGKFYIYKEEKLRTVYQFVLKTRKNTYYKENSLQDLINFNKKAFTVLDRHEVKYHFSKTRKVLGKNGKNGKAGVKGWAIVPSSGYSKWNDNEVIPQLKDEYTNPAVCFNEDYIVIDIDDLNDEMKAFYSYKFDTLYENSNNGIHLLFKNDLKFKKVNTHNQGMSYVSGKVDFLNEDVIYDLRGLGKSLCTTKLDGWKETNSKILRNVSEFFDICDLENNKDRRIRKQLIEENTIEDTTNEDNIEEFATLNDLLKEVTGEEEIKINQVKDEALEWFEAMLEDVDF